MVSASMALYRVKALSPDRSKVEPSLGWGMMNSALQNT